MEPTITTKLKVINMGPTTLAVTPPIPYPICPTRQPPPIQRTESSVHWYARVTTTRPGVLYDLVLIIFNIIDSVITHTIRNILRSHLRNTSGDYQDKATMTRTTANGQTGRYEWTMNDSTTKGGWWLDSEIRTEQIPEGFAVGPGGCIFFAFVLTEKKKFLSASQGPNENSGGQDQARNHY